MPMTDLEMGKGYELHRTVTDIWTIVSRVPTDASGSYRTLGKGHSSQTVA